MGKVICQTCLCILFDVSDWRYERVKTFYRVGAKVITHGNNFRHNCSSSNILMGEAWLQNHLETFSEPMPHENIAHIHVPTKKSVFEDKPGYIQISESSMYKHWDPKVKIPTKNQIFARCPQCQSLRKRCLEAGKCSTAMAALKDERQKHKDLYMAEKQNYYQRQIMSVHHPDDMLCIIYDGMHKEKTKIPRFSANPSKDLENSFRVPCNLEGFIVHRQGLHIQPKQGYGFLNMCYPDNSDLILSCLLHLVKSIESPFPRSISLQFDNASNNKCNEGVAFFAYLVAEEVFHNVYGHTLIVHHTHEDIDRMFENANQKFKKADMVTSNELSNLMKNVPYVNEVCRVPCVWEIMKFLAPFIRTIHDFANVHHFWLHKNAEGNVVLHFKRYASDQWLPDSTKPDTFLKNEDKYGVLIFKEKPVGEPTFVTPSSPLSNSDMDKLKTSTTKLLQHPLLRDLKLEERRLWWNDYLAGCLFVPDQTEWPIPMLRGKRLHQNELDSEAARTAIENVQHEEEPMPLVYSGPYIDPKKRDLLMRENEGVRERCEWPVKKVVKERINQRTHKKQYLVEWKNSWVEDDQVTEKCKEMWEKRKRNAR
ncbi:uncharacterized protein LOC110248173 [Exaiptasia diaphana]|uniref:DUF7869 domain-containing protein n=1 Tax=Exaiptasia diaphana TaxID=2652724 RepID=A0A913XV62_EXADI|nr:uncharacterized protein LOC110248173 [Exaiptasia diaphana]KXJ24444.1 hypothetical protein AC249_AIPGENE22591 [Exaiptasia diaphana]